MTEKKSSPKSTTTPPTVGRVVHYFASEGAEPSAAFVAHVGEAEVLNLATFDRRGNCIPATSVPFVQPGDDLPDEGHYATWPERV